MRGKPTDACRPRSLGETGGTNSHTLMDKKFPMLRFLITLAFVAAVIVVIGLGAAYFDTQRTKKVDYPEYTPTELPVIPSPTPLTADYGKG